MVEEIIVYRRRPTEPSSSLKRKPEKTDSAQEFHTKISEPISGLQNQVGKAKRIKCIFSPRKENSLEKLPTVFSAKSTECESSESLGVVEGNSKRKQRIKTHNDQKKVVAYFDLEALQSELVDVDLNVKVSHRAEKVPFVRLTSESYGKPISGYPLEIGEALQSELVDVNLNVEVSHRAEKVPFVRLTSESYGKPISGYPLEIGEVLQSELVDVNLNVEVSHRAEKVPFVRLMSELYGKPILGYPLEIGVIVTDGSENVARGVSGGKQSRLHQLAWRTSKRTPVCYVTTKASENGVVAKNLNQVNRGKTAPGQTCVPVEVIFSKISSGTTSTNI